MHAYEREGCRELGWLVVVWLTVDSSDGQQSSSTVNNSNNKSNSQSKQL